MKKLISLICVIALLATSIVTVTMPMVVSAAENFVSYDFEGYVGNDETLALSTLTNWKGKWGSYQLSAGVSGPTSVQTDRGTSVNLINNDTTGKFNYASIRPMLPKPVTTSLKFGFSMMFKDMGRTRAARIHNSYTAFLLNGGSITFMGNSYGKGKTDIWYDMDASVNFETGYYVASITAEGETTVYEGVINDLKKYSSSAVEFIELMYFGKLQSGTGSNTYIDDVYVGEIPDGVYKSIFSESDFEDFAGNPEGTEIPESLTASGVSANVNGFYADGGALRVKTGNTTPLTLEKEITVTGKNKVEAFGKIRAMADVNFDDTNADRSFLVGSKEVLKFASDGTVSAGSASATYEAGKDYKISVKIDMASGKATAYVYDGEDEIVKGSIDITSTDVTKVVYKTVQTGSSSEAVIDNFNFYNDNGFLMNSATPASGSKNIQPTDVTVAFSNPVDSVDYVTLNGDDVDYEIISSNEIKIASASAMDFGEDYTLKLGAVRDAFGEEKDFTLTYSTIDAMVLGNVSIADGDNVTAKVTGVANDGGDYSYTLVLAQYNAENNMLINLATEDFALDSTSKDFTVSLPTGENSYYEAYLWDSFDSKNAVSSKATLGTEPLTDVEPGDDGFVENMDNGVMVGTNLGLNSDGYSVIVVLKPGKTADDIETAEKLTDVIDFIKQYDYQETDVIAFTPTAGNGIYSYILDGTLVEEAFDYIDPAYVDEIYEEINKEDVSFAQCIDLYNRILACDTTEFESFTDEEKAVVDEVMHEIRAERENGFDTIASFQDAFYTAVAGILVANSDSADDVKFAFEKYGKYYGIENFTAYKTYEEANDTAKAEVYAAIANADKASKESFEALDEIFGETMVLAAVRNSTKQVQVGNIINDNNDTILHFDFSEYSKITNKSALHAMLVGVKVNTIEEFEAAFQKAVSERLSYEADEKDVSEGVAASGNYIYYDFEGYVGNDETLALSTLSNWYGQWHSYQIATGKAGPTSVQTDRGTSLDVVQRDAASTNNNCVVRPYSKSKITTTAEIKVSVQFKEMNRASALYIYGDGGGQYNTLVQEGTSGTFMGSKLTNKLAPNVWYDIVYRINKVSGYYEATISCADWSETKIGRNTSFVKDFSNFNYLGLGYIGKRTSGDETHIWYDDVSFKEIDPLYIPMLDENSFDSFTGNASGVIVPEGFEATGVVGGENGFFAEDGKVNVKTAKEGDLVLSKNFAFETGYDASVYGVLRTDIDITPKDKNADRKIMIGDVEVARFGADGRIAVGEAYQNYDVDSEYKVTVKADSFVYQRELEDKTKFQFNNVYVTVKQGDNVVLDAICEISSGNITKAKLVVSQVNGTSETVIDNFNVYNDNGFYISESKPAPSETNVIPGDAEFTFSNAITKIDSVTLNDVPVNFEIVDTNKVKVYIKDKLGYNEKYRIDIYGAEDMFGAVLDFKLTFYTAMASKLSNIQITDGDNVKASVSGFSYDGNKYTYALILAKFDSATNKLLAIKKTPISLSGTAKDFSAELEKDEGTYFEAYVWDSAKGMVAIKDKAVLGANTLEAVADKDGYVQNMDTNVVTATNTKAALPGNTLLVLKPGATMNDVMAASDLTTVVDYIAQFDSADADVYAWTPANGAGKYGVAVNGKFTSNAFEYIAPGRIEEVRTGINSGDANYTALINANNDIFGVDTTEFKDFDENETERFEELIKEEKSKLENGFDSVESFRTAYKYAVARVLVENADDANDIKTAFEKYGTELGMKNFVAYNTYAKLSEKGKNAIYDDISKADDLSTLEKIANVFTDSAILRAVQYSDNQTEISNIINNNNDYLNFDVNVYNNLTKKHNVNGALIGNYYGSIASLKSAFNKAVNENSASAGNQGNGSSNGSSSGSSSGFGSLVTLGPVYNSESGQKTTFTDLNGYDWAKPAISNLASRGIVSGRTSTTFDPAANITREEFTKIVINAFTNVDSNLESDFKDVPKGSWYYSYVATANKLGIINGTSKATFGTGEKITRQDMATILFRTAEIFGVQLDNNVISFADSSSISDYAKDAVSALAASGIVNGKGNNCFDPFAFATRAEAAKMIYGLMERGDK